MLILSKNEEDYLKTIYFFESKLEREEKAVSVHLIAEKLAVSSPSATEMIKRLSKKNLVIYKSYYGVNLSELGRTQARFTIKSHRIWETFLVKKLEYSIDDVHMEAENLEHASSPRLIESLFAWLDFPKTDPHGSPIPQELFWQKNESTLSLREAKINEKYYITSLKDEEKEFFSKLNMDIPRLIRIIERLKDGSIIIKEEDGNPFVVPSFIQDKINLIQRDGLITTSIADKS